MDIESLAKSRIGKPVLSALGAIMESPLRYRFFSPQRILAGADLKSGMAVLEVGCGTGYFTLHIARLVGDQGCVTAIDILSESVEFVSRRVESAGLKNVRVIKADVLRMGFDAESFDLVLLFGVIPAPMLPMGRLLTEISRVLKMEGRLAVWPPIPLWLPGSILRSGPFTLVGRRNGVYSFKRC